MFIHLSISVSNNNVRIYVITNTLRLLQRRIIDNTLRQKARLELTKLPCKLDHFNMSYQKNNDLKIANWIKESRKIP